MIETLATIFAWVLQVYLAIGLIAATALLVRGLGRLDPAADGASLGFRAIVFPGLVALWPLLVRRWLSGTSAPHRESNAHRAAGGES